MDLTSPVIPGLEAYEVQYGGSGPENLKRKMRLEDELELRELQIAFNNTRHKLGERQKARIESDEVCRELGAQMEREKKALEHKKAEVFSDAPKPKIEVLR